MVLRSISIRDIGAVTRVTHRLTEGLSVIRDCRRDELAFAIRTVLGHKIPPPPNLRVGAGARISASVSVSGKVYTVLAFPDRERKRFRLTVLDGLGADATEEYMYLTRHTQEQDGSDVFANEDGQPLPRFLKYADEDSYYSDGELSRVTGGLSSLKTFRRYLRSFMDGFQPEPLREGKSYEIILKRNGRYAVKCALDGSVTDTLSECERTLFRYLCFLHTAQFWCGFEELRNMNGVQKPLIISGLAERLDASIDVGALLARTKGLKKQTIFITST